MRDAHRKHRSLSRRVPLFIVGLMILWFGASGCRAQSSLTEQPPGPLRMGLIVGEPFGRFGAMMPQGHASIYLSGMCAATPLTLRRCEAGEHGVVLSRLHDLKQPNGRPNLDWIAMPFYPFLYGVDDPAGAPAWLTRASIDNLRGQYRERHLRLAVPDRFDKHGRPISPDFGADWAETVGAAFDRRLFVYLFDITPEQQAAVLDALLSRPNVSSYSVARHNCADLVWDLLKPVMPGVLHRNFWADFDMMTPKQLSWQTTLYLRQHPELHPAMLEIPQLPGSVVRSRPIRGAAESLITNRLYFSVVLVLQPELMLADAIIYEKRGRWQVGAGTTPVTPAFWAEPLPATLAAGR